MIEKDIMAISISQEKTVTLKNTWGGTFTLHCDFTEASVDEVNNQSRIDLSGYLKSGTGDFTGSQNATLKLYWHDNNENEDKLISQTSFKNINRGATQSISGSITVNHKGDGTLNGFAKIVFTVPSYTGLSGETIQTDSVDLTSIARKATLTDTFGFDIEELKAPKGIALNSRIGSDAFTYSLSYSYNSVTGTLFSKRKLVRSSDSFAVINVLLDTATFNSYNQTLSNNAVLFPKTVQELASLIPNSKSLSIKFTLETFNGDTSLGTSEITFNFEVTGAKFDFNPTLQTNDSLTKTLTGVTNKFIKGVSTVLASFGTAKSQNGSTAKTYHYSSGNESYDLTSTSKAFSTVVSGNTEFLFAITDNRGFKTEYKSKKIGTDYTLLDYSIPLISKVTVQRTESLSKKVKIACEGTYWNKSFGSKTNSITLTARYKLSGSSSWVTISSISPTLSGSKFSYSGQLPVDVATESGVEVEFTVTDLCKSYSLKGSETKSVSIFDIGDAYFNVNGELEKNYSPVITKNDLLNFIYPVGSIYMSVRNTSPQSFLGGTWVSWGSGRVPVGVNTSDTDFKTVEKTGGNKNLQKHSHTVKAGGRGYFYTASADASHDWWYTGKETSDAKWVPTVRNGLSMGWATATAEDTGAGDSGNLQPYITCYMWKRTA